MEIVTRDVGTDTAADYRVMAVEHLALDGAELLARVQDLAADRDAYRELLQRSLDAQHHLLDQRERDRQTIQRLRDENRRLREALLKDEELVGV